MGPGIGAAEALEARVRELREQNAQLASGLEARAVVERANGILAERLGLTIEDASALLRQSARSARVRLVDLATQVGPEAELPAALVCGIAQSARWRAAALRERAEAIRERSERLRSAVEEQARRLADGEATRRALFRELNERICDAAGRAFGGTILLVCECADEGCAESIEVPLVAYERARADAARFLVKVGHEAPEEDVVERHRRFLVVEQAR